MANTVPPDEIYQVLHDAEAAGVDLPKKVDKWWLDETMINQEKEDGDQTESGESLDRESLR